VHFRATPAEWLQQHPLLSTINCTDRTFFVCRLNPTQPSYPAHSTILLRLESPSGLNTKLLTVASSNNNVHLTRSLSSSPLARTITWSPGSQALLEVIHRDHSIGITLLLLVRTTYIWVLFFAHMPFVVNRAFNATPTESLHQCHHCIYCNSNVQYINVAYNVQPPKLHMRSSD